MWLVDEFLSNLKLKMKVHVMSKNCSEFIGKGSVRVKIKNILYIYRFFSFTNIVNFPKLEFYFFFHYLDFTLLFFQIIYLIYY